MAYAKIENGVVVLKLVTPDFPEMEEIPDSVVCGMVKKDGIFVNPTIPLATLMNRLRRDRNSLLAQSDWTALADSALTSEVSAQWNLYRQKLRDLPSGLNTPAKVKAAKWPTKPV
tara:strand:+ start:2531 stop:2875 length:345 start_codon:yes stop_codon:yes gene_type:complete